MNNFNSGADQRLMEDLFNEFVQTWGIDVAYIPRDSSDPNGFDLLFGDDPVKKFTNNYTIECYVQSVDNFEGGEFYSKFGLMVKKQARFLMPNRAWKREVQGAYLRPREGDLLWLSNFGALFEIKYVDEEYFFYPFGKGVSDPTAPETNFYAFSLVVEKFRYNDETIQTSVPEISNAVNSIIATYAFNMVNTGSGIYNVGDIVYQTSNNNINGLQTANAIVTSWDEPSAVLQLNTISGLFLPNVSIFDASTGATWTVNNYSMLTNTNNPFMDNPGINEAANTILNFSETNPFGDS
jgi:hypothetical protein